MSTFLSQQVAPIEKANTNVSEKYVTINSERLIEEFQKRGFSLTGILRQKNGRGRHVVRMRSKNAYISSAGDEMFPEIVFTNSYDRTCAFFVAIGIFRSVCSNGLVVSDPNFGTDKFRVRHIGSEAQIAEETTLHFTENLESIWQVQERLATTQLSEEQMTRIALKAAEMRFNRSFTPEQAHQLLAVTRPEDAGNDAWHVLNRIQEKLINGGVKLGEMRRKSKKLAAPALHTKTNEGIFAFVMAEVGTIAN